MQFYQSKLLNNYATLSHCYTTKQSGNLAFHVGDEKENVIQNHQKLAKQLGYDHMKLVHMKQIHSNHVQIVTNNDNFTNPPTCDAVITNKKGIPLMVMVADCAPLLFYDTKNKTIGVAHAGRTGAFKNIIKNVIAAFKNDFNADTDDIIVSVGPSIGVCCYEVGEEIYQEAKELQLDYAIKTEANRYYLDIRAILQTQLLQEGIKKENIEISPLCNACHTEDFYSYRVEKETGRFAGVILLQE
jgi:hypothetical protein